MTDAKDLPRADGLPVLDHMPYEAQITVVKGHRMRWFAGGSGRPVVFLHGNPTSAYLWRTVMPWVEPRARVIAPDLIGMGGSDQPPELSYDYFCHRDYLDGWFAAQDLRDLVLVVHDWGSALGPDWARRHADRVAGIVFMEALLPPALPAADLSAMGRAAENFRMMRTPGEGEAAVLENNFFVETILIGRGAATRTLTEAEQAAYRAPFPTPQSRRPTLAWPRQIPLGGEPVGVGEELIANYEWLKASPIPKLVFHARPGALNPPAVIAEWERTLPRLESRLVGAGFHFFQEDHPHIIGQGIADWMRRNGL